MDAKRCDRCKKFYLLSDDIEKRPSYAGLKVFDIRALNSNWDQITTYELCADCAKDFMTWMKMREVNSNEDDS